MYPGFDADLSNGGSSSLTSPSSRRTRCRSSASIAARERSAPPAPESTDQLCAIESMRHSALPAEPSGEPSSKYARRYHSPSQPCCSMLRRSSAASRRQRSAKAASPRLRATPANAIEHVVAEKGEPDAFALAFRAHLVHAVVPVARADERQPVLADGDAALDGAHAVLVQARRFARARGQVVIGVVLGVHRAAVEEVDRLVEHRGIPGAQHVARRSPGQPQVIVRAMRAHAAARGRMPPVLHVAVAELMRRAAQQVLAGEARLGMKQRHDVLQLVAEAESAARLVVAAAPPEAARQRLVQEPAVRQQVERRGRAFPPAPRPGCAPSIARTFSSAARGRRRAVHQVAPRRRRCRG